jgi:tetrapyrrole methylase family protein/MazG family protein
LQLASAHHPSFPPDIPALVTQINSKTVAKEIKTCLMAVYPEEHKVRLLHAAGTSEALVEALPLHKIDHSKHIDTRTTLFIPPLDGYTSFEAFQELVAHLRAPEGCPWDREQTHQSLRPNLLEEAYETLSAIDANDSDAMQEEFGDLLLQVVLHAQIAYEYDEFKLTDVINGIHSKLVDRHPHVFGDVEILDAEGVKQNWERLKAHERQAKGEQEKGLLDGIPAALPALAQADAYQKRAARVGFDWPELDGVLDKIIEEVEELRTASDEETQAEEIGDLFFALVNLARWKNTDPESALRATNQKFQRRFAYIESNARDQGRELTDMNLAEMDALWEQAKKT